MPVLDVSADVRNTRSTPFAATCGHERSRTECNSDCNRQEWKPGVLDPLVRAVADDECNGVIIMDTDLCRLYHPYDGGADVILADKEDRDQLKAKHFDWVPQNRYGL